jgi:hypothetical protein
MAFPPQTPTRSPTRSPTYVPSAWKWASAAAAAGDAILDTLQTETDGLVLDFLNNRTLVRTASVDVASTPTALLTYTAPSRKYILGSDGYVKNANHNLAIYSQDFTNAAWVNSLTSDTGDTTTAPDGTTTADTITATATNGEHQIKQTISVSGTIELLTFSCYVKQGTHRYAALQVSDNVGHGVGVLIDLQLGTILSTALAVGADYFYVASSIASAGSSWYRVTLTYRTNLAATTGISLNVRPDGSNVTWSGNWNAAGTETIYAWGAELKAYPVHDAGTLADYIPTTTAARYAIPIEYNSSAVCQGALIEEARTNICLQSEDFTTSWANSNSTETSNSIAAPDGATTADTITASAGNAVHGIFQSGPVGTTAVNYAVSVFAKKGTHRYVALSCNHAAEDFVCAVFDLDGVTGAATETDVGTTSGTIASTSQTSMGNGWFRLVVVGSWTGTNKTPSIGFATAATGNSFGTFGNITFNAAGTETFYLWGAQVELGAFPTSYIKTTSATVTRAKDQISLATSAYPHSATAGYLLVEYSQFAIPSQKAVLALEGVGVIYAPRSENGRARLLVSGAADFSSFEFFAANTFYKTASAWALDNFGQSTNGGVAATDVLGAVPSVSTLKIADGSAEGSPSGYIKFVKYLPRRVSDADLALESAP